MLLAGALPALAGAPPPRRVEVSRDFAAVVDGGVFVEALPIEGEGVEAFAARLSRDEATAREVVSTLVPGRAVRLPWGSLSAATRMAAVAALFPSDHRATAGWVHTSGGEGWEEVAELFSTGRERAGEVARANGSTPTTPPARGAVVKVPAEFLVPPFLGADPVPDEEPPSLEYGEDAKGKYALYRLRKGEALYSSVVVRFTGRLHAEDVIELALRIAERSGIEDVHGIPVGYPVKVPLDELAEEYLPKDDPKAQALLREKAETAQFAPPPPTAAGLAGVRVVLDSGHGGRDAGTIHGSAWEATYTYDVAVRLRKVLLERTRAEVVMMTREPSVGFDAPDRDKLRDYKGRVLLTDPPCPLDDPVVGVNLRWYLANAILRRPGRDRRPIPPERTVFISLHADSLHPSVRGAMAYVPGERFLRDRYGKGGASYARYREWREEPTVSFSRRDRVAAEGVSTAFASRLLSAVREAGLPVHRFSPVRTHVIRGGREWVPAVLRYNRIPARVLIEIANLASDDDRHLTQTRAFRQAMAEALAAGIAGFFGGERPGPAPAVPAAPAVPVSAPSQLVTVSGAPASPPQAPRAEKPVEADAEDDGGTRDAFVGPWPEVYGPWPEVSGPWPRPMGPPAPTSISPRGGGRPG